MRCCFRACRANTIPSSYPSSSSSNSFSSSSSPFSISSSSCSSSPSSSLSDSSSSSPLSSSSSCSASLFFGFPPDSIPISTSACAFSAPSPCPPSELGVLAREAGSSRSFSDGLRARFLPTSSELTDVARAPFPARRKSFPSSPSPEPEPVSPSIFSPCSSSAAPPSPSGLPSLHIFFRGGRLVHALASDALHGVHGWKCASAAHSSPRRGHLR
mmetsp:Transcript_6316/g.15930  ORF Transcript_6316/g.15930 Transcript_6316/m.15930 type:complete len:214 (+) Transcript_6316:982-1623(+)